MEFKLYRGRISEGTIQAECYHRLRLLDIESHMEHRHENCRFDLVIVKDGNILAIIEFKNYARDYSHRKRLRNSKQFQKYSSYGVPVIYCRKMEEVDQTIEKIKGIMAINTTPPL